MGDVYRRGKYVMATLKNPQGTEFVSLQYKTKPLKLLAIFVANSDNGTNQHWLETVQTSSALFSVHGR